MEVVSGGDLSQHVSVDSLLPVADVLQIGFKCCGALAYAFNEGVVHRDIKPANIMIAHGSDVKIADFGAALLRKAHSIKTGSIGSPYYMSPEQLQEAPLTHHSDMYCLGVVLYELLTGQRPFRADSLEMLMEKILHQDPVPPSSLRAALPQEIDRIVLCALGKKPQFRFQTWDAFALELSNAGKLVLPPGAIMDSEKYLALKRVDMLAQLSDAELWELTQAGRWTRIAAKQAIIRENDPGQSFFFLAQGQVKVTLEGRLLNTISEGEGFGEMAYIRGGEMPRHATVETMTAILLAEFEPQALAQMSLGAQLHLTRALARNLVDRLDLANERFAK
jgi:hypothetical protein